MSNDELNDALAEARDLAKARAQEWLDAALHRVSVRHRRRCRMKRIAGALLLAVVVAAAAAAVRYRQTMSDFVTDVTDEQ